LRNWDAKLAPCRLLATQASSRWPYKFPDDPNSTVRMTWVTYNAILKSNGGPFQGRGAGNPFYDFPLSL
jgi:hypothetical protein